MLDKKEDKKEKFSLNGTQAIWLVSLMFIVFISVIILLSFNNDDYARGLSQGFVCSEIFHASNNGEVLTIEQEDLDNCNKVIEIYNFYQIEKYGGDLNKIIDISDD